MKNKTQQVSGWLDNYGKVENANDSNVSFSENFVGLGNNTKGRKFSPAWGGQFQNGGFAPMSPREQITNVVGSQVNPTPTIPYKQTKDPAEFYKSWIQNPEYKKRLLQSGYVDTKQKTNLIKGDIFEGADHAISNRLKSLDSLQPIEYSTERPSDARPSVYGKSTMVINPHDYADTSEDMVKAHEMAHIGGAAVADGGGGLQMSDFEKDLLTKSLLPNTRPTISGVQGSEENKISYRNLEDWEHLKKPQEIKADLDALRYKMYDTGIYDITKGQKFTESDFEKSKKSFSKDRVFKRLENRIGKDNLINLMNVIAQNNDENVTPIANNGASLPGATGMMYARTAGSAPSEGKYTKKTLPSAQTGQNIDRVSTTDPRYAELYRNRQVGSWSPQYNAYNLPDLGEVTVTAPRSYTMDSLRGFTTAALYGAPVNAMKISMIPQAAMTEGIEALRGKPYNFSNVNPNFGGFTSNQRDLSQTMGYENPEGFLQNATNFGLSMIDPLNLVGVGIADDVFKLGLRNIPQKAGKALGTESGLLSNAWKLNPKAYQYNLPENTMWRGLGKEGMEDAVNSGLFRAKQDVNPEFFPGSTLRMDKSFGTNPYFTPKFKTAATYGDNFLAEVPRDAANWRQRYKRSDWSQVADKPIPIDEGRILQKDWLKGYKPIETPVPEMKQGGIVKDNRGYWNPDNWGKPVEIDSNNITMEGVNQPLLGISDTGDTKLMKPGKNYKFKGKKVTEFPVAKLGINQLDAQPMKKLNQLTNFTNNPDKTNWLDKYN